MIDAINGGGHAAKAVLTGKFIYYRLSQNRGAIASIRSQ